MILYQGPEKLSFLLAAILAAIFILAPSVTEVSSHQVGIQELVSQISFRYAEERPEMWGEDLEGVKRYLDTENKVIALTLDACGGKCGSGYDRELINFLRSLHVPATLFINARWIDANPKTFIELDADPLFETGNHGMEHKPCSVKGRSVYGIEGTGNAGEVVLEIEPCSRKIEKLTGKKPRFFRSGTAYYDEVAVKIAGDLGYTVSGYSVLGDAGATFNRKQVRDAVLSARTGDIILCHMNHPEGDTAEGLKDAIPVLIEKGYDFVLLSEYPLR